MFEEVLMKAGLSVREVKAYTEMRLHGEMTALQIAKQCGIIRTNSYDILNNLVKKGIVSCVVKNGKKFFRATAPEKLLDCIENQKRDLDDVKDELKLIIPKLKPLDLPYGAAKIEIYEGKEGLKTILEMSIRESLITKKEILGISVQQEKCRLLAGPYHIRWYNDRAKHKIRSRYLMSSEEKTISVKYTQFKILPPDAKNPNEIFIFGDVTSHFFFVGNNFNAVVINNKEITDKYRQYFEFLWRMIK
jgi:sugar-specific transcriptional regulator TrmB